MGDKPSYLGLLNAIALGESRAHCYLSEWVKVTRDERVRGVLQTVAAREGEHGMAFAKRINELGYTVLDREDPKFARNMEIAAADCSDLEKMEALGLGRERRPDAPDFLAGIFQDDSIDIGTGGLLGRYIAEERDSGRLLRCCYEQLKAEAAGAGASGAGAGSGNLAAIEAKVDALCRAVEDLRQIVCAQTMPAATT